jgi:cellulose synthase/poly-beta-1,6-N-acetylglucosamine synthase-like glycosyltransferase
MLLLYIIIPLFILYSLLLFYYGRAWNNVPDYTPQHTATTRVSIIIPARNEEKHIAVLLNVLFKQSYPAGLTEIIVIDDHSTDQTASVVQSFPPAKLVQLNAGSLNSYKKKAIETGIAAANGDLIITTDADCIPGPEWISHMASFYEEKKAVFIAAPVVFSHNNSLLQVFQALDFLVLQGITAAAVHSRSMSMCNGANMAYEKKAFYTVDGFKDIDQIASGDDMLLMHKIRKQFPEDVYYIKSKAAIMTTAPMLSWRSFFNQRIRWASKARSYSDKRIFVVLLLVYLFNLSMAVSLVAGFADSRYWLVFAAAWIGKTLVELPFVYRVASFYNEGSLVNWFFLFQPLHIFYTLISGLLGQFGSYEWKGRKVK